MKVSILQMDVIYKDKKANLAYVSQFMSQHKQLGDIIVLPELFSTGYIFTDKSEIQPLAETLENSPTLRELQRLAHLHSVIIVAGIAEKSGLSFYNTAVVIDGDGLLTSYQKISQTQIDREYFSRGEAIATFNFQGVTLGVVLCFDLWFPEIVRRYTDANVDVLLHPANFGGEQSLAIARTRAVENQMYIVTSNRIGADITANMTGQYCGNSQIVAPSGEVILNAGDQATLQSADLTIETSRKKVIGVDLTAEMNAIKTQLHQPNDDK